ncbi:autophagy-related protein 11-like [Curcuma longa]|uniref:autophagy-related protein 11-like n=1 Tax=Curcuma longa TaxID=136217 RepID=UPI003D9DF87C
MSSGSMVTSTAVAEDVVLGKKLLVHVAENGHSLEFECGGSTPVEAIQRSIEALCGVALVDQLLLCCNTSLDAQQTLSYYKLPQDDREVFLYNKARLYADSPRPPLEFIDVPMPAVPPPPSPANDPHPLDNAPDPALKALVSYERHFRYHFQVANAFFGRSQAKLELCRRFLREQQVQGRALDTARGNLEHTFKKLQLRYTEFVRCFAQQHKSHSELLANFERDVEKLRSLRLHPRLQSKNRKHMLDLVKEDDLRKCVDSCFSSHQLFETKVSELKTGFAELKRMLEILISSMSSATWGELENAIRNHQKFLNEQKTVMQALSKDVEIAKKLVDDSDLPLSPSLLPHDAVSVLGRIYNVHERNHLPNVQKCDHAMSKLLDKCKWKKNDMSWLVHLSMQKVKSVQVGIRDMINELHVFQEVMGHQNREFENVKFVNGVGQAYRACLAEIVRRKCSLKLYMGLAGQLAEKLATEREAEIRRRESFFKTWSKYIPNDLLNTMGLFDLPSQCDVHITPFDGNLLEIDMEDVDRFAPVSLVGLISMSEKHASEKGFSATCSSSSITKSEESSLQIGEKVDFLEGCESVGITGTSKMEVENAQLKAELASAIAMICVLKADTGHDSDAFTKDDLLNNLKEKTAEALRLKDDFANHLQSMLNTKQEQCSSYEKRIEDLEQRLAYQYLQGQKLAGKGVSDSNMSAIKNDNHKFDIFGEGGAHIPYTSTMPMDELSSTSGLLDPKIDHIYAQASKAAEGGDENMSELSGTLNLHAVKSTHNLMDASMLEQPQDESQVNPLVDTVKMMTSQLTMVKYSSSIGAGIAENILLHETSDKLGMESKNKDALVLDLQNALVEKAQQCDELENQLKSTMEEFSSVKNELEMNGSLLDESQMNCVHLENCLHETTEDAHTNLCAADRRVSEYNALSSKAVKMHSLFERFRSCVTAPGAVDSFADSLHSFAMSLPSFVSEDEEDVTREFQLCIKVLVDKVTFLLSHHCAELSECCSRAEAAHRNLSRELEEKNEQLTSLYMKLQLEKQANKEKPTFGRFEVRELAAFVLNSTGHYEAINRNCPNYYLSEESVALFKEQYSISPIYIIGQIVHIERQVVRPLLSPGSQLADQLEASHNSETGNHQSIGPAAALNPYNLPVGCEYFIVTVAMLPDTIHSAS